MTADTRLVEALRREFNAAADPDRAMGQQAYMKSAMPYHGIMTPEMRRICRELFKAHPLENADVWQATTEALW